jgi:hypothetical protein
MRPTASHRPETVRSAALRSKALSFANAFLDRVEVRAVGREEEQVCAGRLDQGANLRPLVAREVVHDHDVARPELGNEDVLDIGLEGVAVDRPREHEGCDHAAQAQRGDDGRGFPVAVRHTDAQALAAPGTAMGAGHVGLRPGLVDEHQALGVEVGLGIEPGLPPRQDVGTILLAGVRGLFLRVIRCRAKKRCNVP